MRLTSKETKVLTELRNAAEGGSSGIWQDVYLDNCPMRETEPRTFAAILGSLMKKGFYRSYDDDCFGEVKIVEEFAPGFPKNFPVCSENLLR